MLGLRVKEAIDPSLNFQNIRHQGRLGVAGVSCSPLQHAVLPVQRDVSPVQPEIYRNKTGLVNFHSKVRTTNVLGDRSDYGVVSDVK